MLVDPDPIKVKGPFKDEKGPFLNFQPFLQGSPQKTTPTRKFFYSFFTTSVTRLLEIKLIFHEKSGIKKKTQNFGNI